MSWWERPSHRSYNWSQTEMYFHYRMPIHQNLDLLQRSVDFEEVAVRRRQSCPPEPPPHCRGEGCPALPASRFLCGLPGQATGNPGWGQAAPRPRGAVSAACQHPTVAACLSTGDSAPPIPQDARSQTPPEKNLRQPQNQTKIKSVWIYLSLQSNASNGKAWK